MEKKKTKVYIYTRVSTAMQIDGYSLDAQRTRMRAFAEFNDYEVAGEYEDAGKSGKSIEGRDEFNRMMEDIKTGKDEVSFVLVFKLSRFGRNAADVLSTLQTMQDFGVNLICVEDGIDSSKDAGKLMISVLSAVAEIERENKRLEQENMRLNDLLIDYYDIKKEYDELSQFLDIKKDNKSFEVAVASVIGRDPNENFSGFTLNRGINDGISVNAPVLTEKGLVGWISEVGISSCKVTTILSPDTKISACDKASSDKGIVSGSAELYEKGCTSLKNIRKGFKIAKDDIVVTANSVLYPENIKIGKVKEISTDSYTGMPIAVIEPFEDIKNVSSVVIVKKFG